MRSDLRVISRSSVKELSNSTLGTNKGDPIPNLRASSTSELSRREVDIGIGCLCEYNMMVVPNDPEGAESLVDGVG